ncbi:cell division protein ZipN/Ftn2/Arc6 [Geminocystis sp. NIES-3708]|uniref:IMS domain-containing protein n=1 Tax=Geminocystis sp. NIES-3708 TaxID=1615909 RepID=UPI0005FC9836|nr:IMS domain-containing protein [Geminocystis sp. NIES-3708]BAQ62042.1 cell division protein ZipN/Ftn2/Arc6 [Geminocystis sp. NIES-3708]
MQISLDYYRILGIPIQAELNLIEQAYQDRILQLPHKGYSEYAITSRNNLFQQAYNVLKDNESRLEYESSFFSSVTETEDLIEDEEETEESIGVSDENLDVVRDTNIEIDESLFIGALITLLDLGEYELVITLSQPYLKDKSSLNNFSDQEEQISIIEQDLVLSVVLAYLELAREQWQEKQYESASHSLAESYQLLFQEDLFSNLRKEIKQDLGKLRPYQILELLTKEDADIHGRQKGIKLLKEMFNLRGGIESQVTDESGLDIDGFLRFIQQIRVYLTPEEQQVLFEEEAQRPSPAAGYLAAYAGIARGFTERRPEFIIRAKNSLISLTIHQDVYLEQSICALLLGQTAEAEFSLSQSREKKVISYIQEMSQGSPDLLPGLCIYTEKWLQTEVFPQFKNLASKNYSLQEYFANDRVQAYLETITNPLSNDSEDSQSQEFISPELELPFDIEQTSHQSYSFTQFNDLKEQTDYEEQIINENYTSSSTSDLSEINLSSGDVENDKISLLVSDEEDNEDLIGFNDFLEAEIEEDQNPSQNSSYNVTAENPSIKQETNYVAKAPQTSINPQTKTSSESDNNLIIGSLLGLLFLIAIAFGASKLLLSSESSEDKLQISISEPLIELPPNSGETVNQKMDKLDQDTALKIINQWLNAKAQATGPEYNSGELTKILTEPQLSRWVANSRDLRNKNAYKRYEHQVKVESAKVNPQDVTQGIVTAKISEKSQYYRNGALIPSLSYEENLLVKYELIKDGDRWLIKNSQIIKN